MRDCFGVWGLVQGQQHQTQAPQGSAVAAMSGRLPCAHVRMGIGAFALQLPTVWACPDRSVTVFGVLAVGENLCVLLLM